MYIKENLLTIPVKWTESPKYLKIGRKLLFLHKHKQISCYHFKFIINSKLKTHPKWRISNDILWVMTLLIATERYATLENLFEWKASLKIRQYEVFISVFISIYQYISGINIRYSSPRPPFLYIMPAYMHVSTNRILNNMRNGADGSDDIVSDVRYRPRALCLFQAWLQRIYASPNWICPPEKR